MLYNSEEFPGKVTIGQKGKGKKDTQKREEGKQEEGQEEGHPQISRSGKWVCFLVLHGDFQLR